MSVENTKKIPVTIITGFLGSGKSTLLNHLLTSKEHKRRIAVINNEFGSKIGIENEVSKESGEHASCFVELLETANGCICCGGKGDFLRIMQALVKNKDRFDYVIIETTGMADPTFASDFFVVPELKEHFHLDGIVAMVDAQNALQQLDRKPPPKTNDAQKLDIINEAIEQISFADRIIINKTDLVTQPAQLTKLRERLQQINSTATVVETSYSKVDISFVLEINCFDLSNTLKKDPAFMDFRPWRQHDSSISSVCFVAKHPMNLDKFKLWLGETLKQNKENIFRSKGVIAVSKNEVQKYVFQGVHDIVELSQSESAWKPQEPKMSKLIFIGKNINQQQLETSFKKEVGVTIKTEEEVMAGAPSVLGLVVLILFACLLLYPGDLTELLTLPIVLPVIIVLISLFWWQNRRTATMLD